VLTVVTLALRRHLERRHEDVDELELKAFVPVSVRPEEQRGTLGNQVSGMIAALPVSCSDPALCLERISAQMRVVKHSGQAVGAQALTELSGFAPPTLIQQASRLVTRQRFVNLVVTNVPGPQFPLYLDGRELTDMFPMVPLGTNLNLGIAIVSYNGTLNFGLVGDFNALHDLEDLADDFLAALGELADAAGVANG
jgi:diacylglycerol O-acyltransferase